MPGIGDADQIRIRNRLAVARLGRIVARQRLQSASEQFGNHHKARERYAVLATFIFADLLERYTKARRQRLLAHPLHAAANADVLGNPFVKIGICGICAHRINSLQVAIADL